MLLMMNNPSAFYTMFKKLLEFYRYGAQFW